MAIQFHCPFCTAPIRVPDSSGGKRGRCPKCKSKLRVPKPDVPLDAPVQPAAEAVSTVPQTPDAVALSTPGSVDELPVTRDATSSETAATTRVAGQHSISYARALQRRRSRKPLFWIPLLFGTLLVGGIAGWFFYQGSTRLEGTLEAVELIEPALEPKTLGNADIALESDKIRAVYKYLKEKPVLRLSGELMEHEISVTDAGLSIQVFDPARMRFYRVDVSANAGLRKYYKDNQKSLNETRLKALEKASTAFFEECLSVAKEGGTLSSEGLQRFRNQVAVNRLIGGLGYNVVATVSRKAYLCVYEDKKSLYFLLPVGTKRFTLKGREFDGVVAFPGKFKVEVTGVKKPPTETPTSKASETSREPEKTDKPEKTEKSQGEEKTE